MTIELTHSKVTLALHELRAGEGRSLLYLHGLGLRAPSAAPSESDDWPGPVHALDFTGHGASTIPVGGGYTAELLMADADAAVARLGAVTLVGSGLGAYIGLLLAGARPKQVRGAILCDGSGLAGGGPHPVSPRMVFVDPSAPAPPDPFALVELGSDLRPPDYATSFARLATQFSGLTRPISVCAVERPDWLRAVVEEVGVEEASLEDALAYYAAVV
ncbi:MAG: alpha/beta hydrolase [Deltaproteobacteria bacterium]|nr:MAG: alpha/beta hydrolase [Deltaproteobacteria bacterium]